MNESDGELVARCKNGDMSAFDLIVHKHKVPLINFAYRFIGDRYTAEDLVQETFVRVYKNIKRYREDAASFRTWMYRIAANLCKNELRNRSTRSRILVNSAIGAQSGGDRMEEALDDSMGPDLQLEERELQRVLAQTISRLPEKLRISIILRDIEGMTYEEISRVINRPIGTVKSRINRARLMLKDKMSAYMEA
jgi:RNA polymerase sigma-70 factor (ECF subfamily)